MRHLGRVYGHSTGAASGQKQSYRHIYTIAAWDDFVRLFTIKTLVQVCAGASQLGIARIDLDPRAPGANVIGNAFRFPLRDHSVDTIACDPIRMKARGLPPSGGRGSADGYDPRSDEATGLPLRVIPNGCLVQWEHGDVARNAGAAFSLKYHLVWCPKYRRPVLTRRVAERLGILLSEKATQVSAILHVVRVMPDHVHLFVETHPTCSPARLIGVLKGYTSRVLRCEFTHLRDRLPVLWSRSYYIGTVGHVSEQTVRRYITAQKER